jgi:hypothetical protein
MRRARGRPRPALPHLSITILGTSFSEYPGSADFALAAAARDLAVVDLASTFGYLYEYIIEYIISERSECARRRDKRP